MTGRQQGAARRLHVPRTAAGRGRLISRRPASRPASHRETGTLHQATRIRPDTGPTDRRRILAAVLSALVPGLGQAYNRRSHLALGLFVPFAIVVAVALLAVWAIPAPRLIAIAIVPSKLDLLLGLNLVLLAWRLVGPGPGVLRHAGSSSDPAASGWSGWPWSVLVTVAPHVGAQYVGGLARSTFAEVFDGDVLAAHRTRQPARSRARTSGSTSCSSGSTPAAGRDHALTDSLIVVSLDPVGKSVSMASLPRDLVNVPLGDGRTFAPKLNSLLSYATAHPKDFKAGGMRTLENAVGALLGIPIHYYATVDLAGFAKMVDAVGGVDVNVKQAARRPEVRRLRDHRTAGRSRSASHHFDGANALAYARIRRSEGQTDFTRQARQQEILLALRAKVVKGDALFSLPSLLDAVGKTVATDLPPERLPDLAVLAGEIPAKRIVRVVVRYPARPPRQAGREPVRRRPAARPRPDPGDGRRPVPGPRATPARAGTRSRPSAAEPDPDARPAGRRPRLPRARGSADRRGPIYSPSAASRPAIRRAARARCEIRCFSAADHRPRVRPPGGSLGRLEDRVVAEAAAPARLGRDPTPAGPPRLGHDRDPAARPGAPGRPSTSTRTQT